MWIYEHAKGAVHEMLPGVLEELHELLSDWSTDERLPALQTLVATFEQALDASAGQLVPHELASVRERALARDGYLATLDLTHFLDRSGANESLLHGAYACASFVLFDLLEEWRPYIGIEDQALHLVVFDGMSSADALALLQP